MQAQIPRIMLAGSGSGCGKTSLSCAILLALKNRGLRPAAFKCGPDYIDPMFHRQICGGSCNLDSFFLSPDRLRYLLWQNSRSCDISLIEGVMGFYDGQGLVSTKGSSYELARLTETPVILILDAKGAALSVLAVIKGFLEFLPDNMIKGVILNRCTEMSYKILAEGIRKTFPGRLEPLGYMPEMKDCSFESRRLGLISPEDSINLQKKLESLATQAEKSLDIEKIAELSRTAAPLNFEALQIKKHEKVRIAFSKDRAFCFYYEDNLRLLQMMGAELAEFSPLEDKALPENIDGLYLCGGYPELWAEKLSQNKSMLKAVKEAVSSGLPTLAECGGFMYLTESIGGFPMAGVIKGGSFDTGKLSRFGYIKLKAEKDCMLCRKAEEIPAHEFHYWDAEDPGSDFRAEKANGRSWSCVHCTDSLYAGFPHFHFYSNPDFAENFYLACLKEKK